ncbi:hypothetical protein GCM10007940_45810 [Portibacter lacus]|uniref:Uncharacterized protein n=1 Tax=Portibacter lacus TaxID=1099794 RepID=A0AA37WIN0_9BACT|nr:hypothetical protein GCM10007940_45810 [Portibacter lacus]
MSRKESQDRVDFEARLDDILWRKSKYDIGDTITFGCQKKFYYPLWWLKTLADGLQDFLDGIPSLEKINELYPDIDLDKEEDVIRLIKIAHEVEDYVDGKSDHE